MDSQFFNRKRFIALCRWDLRHPHRVFRLLHDTRRTPRQCPQPLRQPPTRGRMESHIGRPRPRRGRKLDFRECPVFPDSCRLPYRHSPPDTKGIAGHVPSCPHAYLPRVGLRAISAPLALCRPTRLVDLLRGIRRRRLHTCGALQPHRPASGLCPPAAIR